MGQQASDNLREESNRLQKDVQEDPHGHKEHAGGP